MKPWVKTGLIWAAYMFIIMTFVYPYILPLFGLEDEESEKHPVARLVINAVVFTIAGLFIGYRNRNNKKVKKQIVF